ncbi:MAG TPA: hypothetical protein VMQ62_03610 [Dongiaceae bacterium]|nr:hypothetical protein [Dongiaceae bacterium]
MRPRRSTRRLPAFLFLAAGFACAPGAAWSATESPAKPPDPAPAPPGVPPLMVPTPRPVPPKPALPPPGPTTLEPKAWPRSTYSFDGRIEISVGNATFEAPPAYQQSFSFWIGRMKGTIRTELVESIVSTREAGEGRLPYRRQITRYAMEMNERGELKESGRPLTDQVLKLTWEGDLDPRGNVVSETRTAGPEETKEIDRLAFPILDCLFPRLAGARTLKGGESFVESISMPLPTTLSVKGLEAQRMQATRRFTLREVDGSQARFDVSVEYAPDPATPPTAPRTTIAIAGGGKGEAVFDLENGLWTNMRVPTQMTIDIEAPLRVLPGQPEGVDPGTAKTHLPIGLALSGKRTVSRLFDDPPLAASEAKPEVPGAAPAAKPESGRP